MNFPADRLRAALAAIPPESWSLPSTFAATKVHHGYRRVVVVEGGQRQPVATLFGFVLDELDPVWSAWLSWIDPGGFIVAHRDAGPYRERWQVPISTAGTMNNAPAVDGVPFQVAHWERHSVSNPSDRPRVHLVVDRDVIVNDTAEPFAVLEEV